VATAAAILIVIVIVSEASSRFVNRHARHPVALDCAVDTSTPTAGRASHLWDSLHPDGLEIATALSGDGLVTVT
jgi:hypothetical protein